MNGNASSKADVKLALADLLDEALDDVIDYQLDGSLVFNYLMIAALANSADIMEKSGKKLNGDSIQDIAKKELMEMIERLLLEAELPEEISKLGAYGSNLEGIKEMLNHLLSDSSTGKALLRQVAFLFDLEEIENTTVLGLTMQDILKDAKHRLRPWELSKHRKIKGLKTSKVPKLAYSQVFCFYRVLPEHTEGPVIGVTYE